MHEADTQRGIEQHLAGIINIGGACVAGGRTAVRGHAQRCAGCRGYAINIGRVIEGDINPLRPVLQEPATGIVVTVIAPEKVNDAGVGYAVALEQPVAASIQ